MSTPLNLPEPQPAPSRRGRTLVISLAVLAAVALAAAIAWQQWQQSQVLAAVDEACRESVTEWAKYPGGVSFPHELEYERVNDSSVWRSEGVVDFPNGWGTPVRQDFSCHVSMDGTDVVIPVAVVTSQDED
ncbi:MAG: hypothetical protein Q4G50_03830 [Corynebacterium sp.]|uniref:hypothetical protein n=1 Tax=Corynebacterium sp. TaxID=1720 RepID=UPI0026E0BEB4|nr:hypothetical protein [Corynebacterium sp.]MDO5669112.1 hypothetical protein [Corynebacterium sp.]